MSNSKCSGMFMSDTSCTRAPARLISRMVQSTVVQRCGVDDAFADGTSYSLRRRMENSTAGMVKEYWEGLARSRRRSLALLCIGIPAILFGAAAWYDHEVSLRAAREQVSSTADALSEHARTVLSSAE